MWFIVGLGNPGRTYSKTRHNLGFMVLDALSHRFSIPINRESKNYIYGKGNIHGKDVILVKPLTFMNRSGLAVNPLLKRFGVPASQDLFGCNMIVVHDDLDLNTGILRIKKNGSSGGHKGVESIIENTGTKDFVRLRLGIGRPHGNMSCHPGMPAEDYVLGNFSTEEMILIKKCIEKAVEAIGVIIDKGISYAQSRFHRK